MALTLSGTSGITGAGIGTIDSSGANVTGVGTFSADTSLSIADKIVHTGDTNTTIRFPAADTITAETGGSERIRIDSGGRVGVNVTSPDSNFLIDANGHIRVGSGSGGKHIMWARAGLTAELVIGVDGYGNAVNNEATIQSGTGRPLVFMTNGAERVRIDMNGNTNITGITTAKSFVPTEGQLSNRNLVINGAMAVAQRATSCRSV